MALAPSIHASLNLSPVTLQRDQKVLILPCLTTLMLCATYLTIVTRREKNDSLKSASKD